MPEGDTIFRAARTLHLALAGRPLTRCDLRFPSVATVDLSGQVVNEVVPVGKHLLARTDHAITLHSHLKMDGSWHVYRHGQRWNGGAGHEVRAVLENEEWVVVGYRLPVLEVLNTSDEQRIIGHLGPDILSKDWNALDAAHRIRANPDVSIGEALLDQRNVAGIGNLYKNESLFLAGVDPSQLVRDVDVDSVLNIAHRLMSANVSHWSQTTTGDTRPGYRHWVFERGGKACRRCGTHIEVTELGRPPRARLTYKCPACQPAL